MKRIVVAVTACFLAAGATLAAVPGAASAAESRRDTPGCVTRWEFAHAAPGMTRIQVIRLFGTAGREVARADGGYWLGAWVEDGHWVRDGYWDADDHWVDLSYYEDLSYYDRYDHWVSETDTVRAYKKCRSFDGGIGRVGIRFDNHTSYLPRMRLHTKVPSRPWLYLSAPGMRTVAQTAR
jgi:hypothetical protein